MAKLVTIPALLKLFILDKQIHEHELALAQTRSAERIQDAKLSEMAKKHQTCIEASLKLQTDIGAADLEIKSQQERIDKMRANLNQTKSNKEYSAILLEISALKAAVAKAEGELLEQMQKLENLKNELAAQAAAIATETTVLNTIRGEQGDKVKMFNDQISALKAQRDQAVAVVANKDALRLYERTQARYPGEAMAPIVQEDPRDEESLICGACYMGLHYEHLNMVRGRDEPRKCNSCARILFADEMLAEVTGRTATPSA
ncbi:MAG: hypothetical protein WCJ97_08965 [Phycisphaerae bacterium]